MNEFRKMNERIRELAEQAGLEAQTARLKIYKNDDGTVISGGWEYPIEKFAQLIARECGSIYEKMDNGSKHLGTDDYLEALCKHFGVKHFGVEE